jgi:hypothetical protein
MTRIKNATRRAAAATTAARRLGSLGGLAGALLGAACSSGRGAGGDDIEDRPDASVAECMPTSAGTVTMEKIATWRDDTRGAYSIIHDDMCGPGLEGIEELAVPALEQAGFGAGLAPIVEECEGRAMWNVVADAERRGNEIISHSFTHPEISPANAAREVTEAKAAFDAHLENPISFYVFPYDYFTPETIALVGAAGHLGARAGNRDDNDGFENPPINPSEAVKDLEVEFDVWPRNYSKYALWFPEEILLVHAHNAIERGGWALREFHSVVADDDAASTDRGFGPITISAYRRHLSFLRDAWDKGVLWTAPPSTILRYRHARVACQASVSGETISFDTANPDCTKYATPVSVIVTTSSDLVRLDGNQGGEQVATRKLGPGRFSVTADPTRGPVSLTGCSNPGFEIDPGLELAARPPPAESVCLIETVAGAGGAGKMDDLERTQPELQILPNPAQADGRTGSWSWYPQNVQVAIASDGPGHALRYAGTALGTWSGVTLAFLGGNGAGSCYDATRYTGIRFRIRGSVTATDELDGKVVVSVVTAETQSRLYGGDLVGEGGHFNKVISITPGWQTVSIPWADLGRPTWGDTMSLTAVAKEKLQAIDWGITIAASSFEIFLDDIELY